MGPAPAVLFGAEQHKGQAAQRQQVVGDDEIFQVQDGRPGAQGLESAPQIEAQDAGDAQEHNGQSVDGHAFFPAPAVQVHAKGDDVLKYGNHRGQGCKGQEHKEQHAPEPAARHLDEQIGNGQENQGRTGVRLDPEGEAGGDDDESGHESHKGIQRCNGGGLAEQAPAVGQVGSEYQHGANADGQGKEGLAHGGVDHIPPAQLGQGVKIGYQVEMDPFFRSFQEQGVAGQDDHQQQQGAHHPFGDPFHPVLDPQVADTEAHGAGEHHPEQQVGRIFEHGSEGGGDELGRGSHKGAGNVEPAVVQHPAGNRGVVHHQHVAAHDADGLEPVPAGTGRFQHFEAFGGAAAAAPADGEFADHHRDPHNEQEHQIDQDKGGASELAAQVGELPHIPDADGTAGAHQDESQPGAEGFCRYTFLRQKNTSFQNVTIQ